jgi:hypothetical protein
VSLILLCCVRGFVQTNSLFHRSYKYHSRALVINPKNLIRLWDIAYDGYNGGKDDRAVDWAAEAPGNDRPFNQSVSDMSVPYNGPSLMVMKFHVNTTSREYKRNWPRCGVGFTYLMCLRLLTRPFLQPHPIPRPPGDRPAQDGHRS